MKAKLFLFTLTAMLMIATTSQADNLTMKDEAYIPDIPFNTSEIFQNFLASDTNCIFLHQAEEAYVDDIPFDTYKIASQYLCQKAMQKSFKMKDEAYVNDIPFNTQTIAKPYLQNRQDKNELVGIQ